MKIHEYQAADLFAKYGIAVPPREVVESADESDRVWVQETDAPPCHECGTLMVRNGACHKCPNCGSTSGCS